MHAHIDFIIVQYYNYTHLLLLTVPGYKGHSHWQLRTAKSKARTHTQSSAVPAISDIHWGTRALKHFPQTEADYWAPLSFLYSLIQPSLQKQDLVNL